MGEGVWGVGGVGMEGEGGVRGAVTPVVFYPDVDPGVKVRGGDGDGRWVVDVHVLVRGWVVGRACGYFKDVVFVVGHAGADGGGWIDGIAKVDAAGFPGVLEVRKRN